MAQYVFETWPEGELGRTDARGGGGGREGGASDLWEWSVGYETGAGRECLESDVHVLHQNCSS